jgi:hypothetical protein
LLHCVAEALSTVSFVKTTLLDGAASSKSVQAVADGLETLLESPWSEITSVRPDSLEILRQLWGHF